MKSYEERLPLIDEAIEYYKGKLPRKGNPNSSIVAHAFGRYYFITEECFNTHSRYVEFVCYEEEFEKRAKELGWIIGYPIQSEHERLVNQARTLSYPMDVFHEPTARVMIEAGWRPTKEEK